MAEIPPFRQSSINQQDNIFHSIIITSNDSDWY